MKYEKGITTSSVIIYVIAITVVIGTFSVISANFYNSIRTINQKIHIVKIHRICKLFCKRCTRR